MMSVNYSTFQPAGKFGDHPFRVPFSGASTSRSGTARVLDDERV